MDFGTFSVSLSVKDIRASREFYEKLGFVAYDDNMADNWMIMQKGSTFIGLFQGMFEGNILTFNPTDVRSVQRQLKANGINLQKEADETTESPEHIILVDPDGNCIMLDQHDPNYLPTSKK